ncbi:hypothetical protein ZHAS_00010272 [Anopheles sinensis]|uniref:Uncharacterized protein n=1 Tax=Anopheles sinensis TaxID=74873 RepID=A0A084VX65_ANOSI|nr:hypothetical protein ZHAS_00010272 [Anopheles sinensis]
MKSVGLLVVAAAVVLVTVRDCTLAGAAMLSEMSSPGGAGLGTPLLADSVHEDGSAGERLRPLLVLPKDSPQPADSKPNPLSLESLLMPRVQLGGYAHRHTTDTEEEDEEDDVEEIERASRVVEEPEEEDEEGVEEEDERGREEEEEDDDEANGEPGGSRDKTLVDSDESRFSFYSHPATQGHGIGSKMAAELRQRGNPCDSAILEYLKSSEHVVPVRRSPEEEDSNFYIDVSHDALETYTGIVPGIDYKVEVRRSPSTEIRDFYIESLIGELPQHDSSPPDAVPFGKFATDYSEFASRQVNTGGYQQPPTDTDSIPRNTWIDDMEKDWLHHTFATRQQQRHQQRPVPDAVGQRVVFGEPFPAYYEPSLGSNREHDTEEDEEEQNSIEFEEVDDSRRRTAGARPHACPGNVWQEEFMFDDRSAIRWSVPPTTSAYQSTVGFGDTFNRSSSNEEVQQRPSRTLYFR